MNRRSFLKGLGAGIACIGLGVKFGVADDRMTATEVVRRVEERDARLSSALDAVTRNFIIEYRTGVEKLIRQKGSLLLDVY